MIEQAKALSDELIRLRRDIHAHPELGFQEVRTAALVADTLQEIGGYEIKTQVGKTGVVAEIGSGDGPVIGIRADMDALPIIEESKQGYVSTNNGVMHACGHDAHTAILLGVAHMVRDTIAKENIKGRVRLFFQPAEEIADEEGKSGAMRMIEEGAMKGVDAVIALHVDSTQPVGEITVKGGWQSAAVDTFSGYITGTGGHGAYPHGGTDPLWMLIPVLTALHGIVPRRIDPLKAAVISVGQVHAGAASNVIPSEVFLQGTIRSYDPDVREQLLVEIERAFAVARSLGGDYRLSFERGYPPGWADERVAGWLRDSAIPILGEKGIDTSRQGMGAEDFAYMCQEAPGAMFNLGAAVGDFERGHHTPVFDIDESCMPIGAAILADTAIKFLKGEYKL